MTICAPWSAIWADWLQPLLVGILAIFVSVPLGIKLFERQIAEYPERRRYGRVRKFWSSRTRPRFILVSARQASTRQNEPEPRTSFAQAFGIGEVARALSRTYGPAPDLEIRPIAPDATIPEDWWLSNIVIVGSAATLRAFGVICDTIPVPYYQHGWDPGDRRMTKVNERGEVSQSFISTTANGHQTISHDYGTAVRIVRPLTGSLIVLYNGNYGVGLQAAIMATVRPETLNDLSGFDPERQAQCCVVEVSNIRGNVIPTTHPINLAINWIGFNVESAAVEQAISDAADSVKVRAIVNRFPSLP